MFHPPLEACLTDNPPPVYYLSRENSECNGWARTPSILGKGTISFAGVILAIPAISCHLRAGREDNDHYPPSPCVAFRPTGCLERLGSDRLVCPTSSF